MSQFQVGGSVVEGILKEADVSAEYAVESLMKKDSLEIDDTDRALIGSHVASCQARHILIVHGTDTMAQTAAGLETIRDKTIVLTGAMQPAKQRSSDARFNIGFAMAAVQTLPAGVYIAMNGQVFESGAVRKNRQAGRFEKTD